MMKLAELKHWLDTSLGRITDDPAEVVAERNLFILHYLGIRPETLYMAPDLDVESPDALNGLRHALDERLNQRKPLQYLLGQASFYGLTFKVTPAVLIPRPETELLVEKALAFCGEHSCRRLLDLGAGSGCVAVAIKHTCPDIHVTAVDHSLDALAVARENAASHGVEIRFLGGSWYGPVQGERFDVMVSNPPYISLADKATLAPEVLHEPSDALFSPDSPYELYQQLMTEARDHLTPGGAFFFEMGQGQGETLQQMAEALGYQVQVFSDLAGINRVIQGTLP